MEMPENGEQRKPSRTMSGVTPVAVMLKPRQCNHGACIYCPSQKNVPQSYTEKSPAVMRALLLDYSPFAQVKARLKAYRAMNHPDDKIELIIMGGSFLQYETEYKQWFVQQCFDALNNRGSKNLGHAKKLNERARHRCVALCIEARPDDINENAIKELLDYGCTRVEIGVQAADDELYKKIYRGHTVSDVVKATQLLKDAGFKVGYHIMPGLPSYNPEKDTKLFKEYFSNDNFKPDQLKIYPCQVIKGSLLEEQYEKKRFKPYDYEIIKKLLKKFTLLTPRYCRIMRMMRELPPEQIVSGTIRIDVRRDVDAELAKESIRPLEIRSREIGPVVRDLRGKQKLDLNVDLKTIKYRASKGTEYFVELSNKDEILFGLLRLRIPNHPIIPELKDSLIVRELHVYGPAVKLSEQIKGKFQHKGFGKALMQQAEKIAKENKIKKIAVISGIGVREYYKNLGYSLEGDYMVKYLN